MKTQHDYDLHRIGHVRSSLESREVAPRQGGEGAPDAWLELANEYWTGLEGLRVGDSVIVLTWFHQARRDVLKLHPRGEEQNPLTGVFATRSPDRPNPIGLHRVRILDIGTGKLRVAPLEAIDGTPIVDLKPVLDEVNDD
jgi:tRNA-Thr(GGU) m(6)t(6)A37 methyltransferase TsaA